MIVKTIIPATKQYAIPSVERHTLNISEFFYDTIQGEGINTGIPSAFLRLQGCTLNCIWCDTKEVWGFGNTYSFNEVFKLIDATDLIQKFKSGMHLVLTGGSPLLQQYQLTDFFAQFKKRYGFIPYIEVENEAVLPVATDFKYLVSCWNNSPKLSNSGMTKYIRYKPGRILQLSRFKNSWFKFVISDENDWREIEDDFILPKLIKREQIILMPEGATWEELVQNRMQVVEIAIKNQVRYSTREHVVLWDKKTGV